MKEKIEKLLTKLEEIPNFEEVENKEIEQSIKGVQQIAVFNTK